MKQFRDILGWSEMKEREHFLAERQSPNGWTRPIIAGLREMPGRADLKVQYGSYRKLPESVSHSAINLHIIFSVSTGG